MAVLRILTLVCGIMTSPGIITFVFIEEMNAGAEPSSESSASSAESWPSSESSASSAES
jgi:hypothetical protein